MASVFEKLNTLCDEIEVEILSITSEKETRLSIAALKDRAYLDRSPEAEFATLLFRKFREVSCSSGGVGANGDAAGGNTIAGVANYMSQPGRPLYYVNEITEGTSETLVGKSASNSHIFKMRVVIAVFQMIGFIILAANSYVHQGLDLNTTYMLSLCPSTAASISGRFDMRLFQLIAALGFFGFFLNFCLAVYYLLPVDEESGRKFIPGFHANVERALSAINSPSATQHTRTSMESLSHFCFNNAKLIELSLDSILLICTLLFLIIGAIEVDRGAEFSSGSSSVWFTLGTFYMTYKDCMEHPDPAASIRASYAMMFIACFVSSLTVAFSYDSFQKYKRRYMSSDGDGCALEAPMGKGSAHDGRSLISNQDEVDDEVVQVDL